MAIPASNIVNVTSRVIDAGGTALEMAGLILTKNPLALFPTALSFSSTKAVGEYFGLESDEYKVAAKYFLGYDNSFVKPRTLWFFRSATEALAGELAGGEIDFAAIKKINNGDLTISVDGQEVHATELDFTGADTESDVAEALAAKVTTANFAYNPTLNIFVVTSKTTGADSSVSFASGETAKALGLTEEEGAQIGQGSDALSPSAVMENVVNATTNWATFTTLYEPEDEETLGYASWVNSQQVNYLYSAWTTDTTDTQTFNTTNLPHKLEEGEYEGVCLTYGNLDYAILPMAFAASIDWDRENGLPTFKFKSQSGLAANVTDERTANALSEMRVNFYGRYATRADDFTLYAEGAMIAGDFDFIDTYLGMVWLKNALQLACMVGFTNAGRVPYNDPGYTMVKAWFADTIAQAKINGVIQSGVTLSQSQKAQLTSEIGEDKSSVIETDGYYLKVADPGAQARQNRETPVIGLWYTYGGAIHRLDVPVTLVK